MRLFTLFIITICFSACSQDCVSDSINPEAIKFNDKGVMFRSKFKYDSAKVYFKKAIETAPCYYEPHSNMAGIFIKEKDLENAKIQIEFVVEKEPDQAEYWMLLGMLNTLEGYKEEANSAFAESIKLYENRIKRTDSSQIVKLSHLRYQLGIVHILAGNSTKGNEYLTKLAKNNPSSTMYKKALKLEEDDWYKMILDIEKK